MRKLIGPIFVIFASAAQAEVPAVVTDIAPIRSLVAQVMAGVGTPDQTIPPGASPHSYAMRPSEAAALQNADLIVWVGPSLTPWMTDLTGTLAPDAAQMTLENVAGTTVLPFRETAIFDHDEGAHEDDHSDGIDPHMWLDPVNAQVWVAAIAEQLAKLDPDNSAVYRSNAAASVTSLKELDARIAADFASQKPSPFVVFHDAFQYFEARYNLPSAGAISLADASAPSPARLVELRGMAVEKGITCFFAEPQFNADLAMAIQANVDAKVLVLDPIGAAIPSDEKLYSAMISEIATAVLGCGH